MKIYIDISVFLGRERSLGQISGSIELPCVPSVGVNVSFTNPPAGRELVIRNGFPGYLPVTNVQLVANSGDDSIVVNLDDLVLANVEDAQAVIEFLVGGFNLIHDNFQIP